MDRHLVSIKVGIESFANERMQFDSISFNENRLKSLNAHSVKRRSSIQENRMVVNDLFEDIPNLGILTFEHLFGTLNRISMTKVFETPDNKWLI